MVRLKEEFPEEEERLGHIFAKQVYGLAPTEIIYRIATNFILGFSEDVSIDQHNFRKLDALPYVKEGSLSEKLDELYRAEESEKNISKHIRIKVKRPGTQ